MSAAQDVVQGSLSDITSFVAQDSGLEATGDIYTIIFNVLTITTGLLGSIALLILIWSGFQYMAAAGNDNQIASAKRTAFWAIAGLVIVAGAYIILQFVQTIFGPPA